jgi:hypothetical protein
MEKKCNVTHNLFVWLHGNQLAALCEVHVLVTYEVYDRPYLPHVNLHDRECKHQVSDEVYFSTVLDVLPIILNSDRKNGNLQGQYTQLMQDMIFLGSQGDPSLQNMSYLELLGVGPSNQVCFLGKK